MITGFVGRGQQKIIGNKECVASILCEFLMEMMDQNWVKVRIRKQISRLVDRIVGQEELQRPQRVEEGENER